MNDPYGLQPLLPLALAGDREARAGLLGKLRDWARARATALVRQGRRFDCSDIAQVLCLRIHENFDSFQGQTVPQLLAWCEQVLRNVVADCQRRNAAQKRNAGREVAGEAHFAGLAGTDTSPSQRAQYNERLARLAAALQCLSQTQRLVFQLRLYEGLPFEEVARRVGVTAGNARVLMMRATERLRQELEDDREHH
jgi:RNA polymerase sigma-70 factor (ECF subfamily)